jgi:hypothetical protein
MSATGGSTTGVDGGDTVDQASPQEFADEVENDTGTQGSAHPPTNDNGGGGRKRDR